MRRFLGFGIYAVIFTSVIGGGCIFSPTKTKPIVDLGEYEDPTSPENVINNLEVSYRRKEPDKYGPLLRHDFIFRFQEEDAQAIGQDFWTKDEDSTGTHRLFTAPDINDIRIELTNTGAEDPTEVGFPEGTKLIRISPTFLEVDQAPDITLVVTGDIQDFFFLKGNPEEGENPDWWYILEWRDRGDIGGKPGLEGAAGDPGNPGKKEVSWGELTGFMGRE